MRQQFEKLSEQLAQARSRLADHRHGGVVLSGEEVEEIVQNFGAFVRQAREIESQLSEADRIRRAGTDCRVLVNGRGAAVLAAFRGENTNVVAFPRRMPGSGGDAA